jgi:hypothetical protein
VGRVGVCTSSRGTTLILPVNYQENEVFVPDNRTAEVVIGSGDNASLFPVDPAILGNSGTLKGSFTLSIFPDIRKTISPKKL